MTLRYLSNTYNPNRLDAKDRIVVGFYETQDEAWNNYLNWLKNKVIGDPRATEHYTVEQLKELHYVGVYIEERESEK